MKTKVLAALAVLTLGLAACSSSKSDTASSTTKDAPTTKTTTGITDTEIKVSGLGYKAFYAEGLIGAQARFKRANDAGGVNGRKIVLTEMVDDNQTPAQNNEVAKRIVEQDKPFAVVPVLTAAFPAAEYLNQQGVPFVGWGIVPDWCKKEAGFSLTGCIDPALNTSRADFVPVLEQAFPDKDAKGKKIAIVGADNDSAKISTENFAQVWEHGGAEVVVKSNSIPLPPIVLSDYTPIVQPIIDAKADYVMAVSSTTDGIGVAKRLKELGYTGVIQEFSLYDPRIAGSSKGIYNEITFASWQQTDSPGVQQMIKDVDAIDPKAAKGLAMEAGYWSADLFISILEKAGKDLSRESFLAAGKNFKYDGQGVTADLQWPANWTEGGNGISLVLGDGVTYSVTVPFTAMELIPTKDLK